MQGLRRPIPGTALHTGRLSEPYRCAGRTRNRLTTSYLTITAAHAFFNARLRQCPNSDSLLTALFAASAVVHIHIATATLPVKHFHRAPPATPEVLATHHQLHSKPDDSPTTLFLSTHCQHYRSPDDHRKKPVRRNLANRHAGPQEADFWNGTAQRLPFRTPPLCGQNAQPSDNQLFDNHHRTGIFQYPPPVMS